MYDTILEKCGKVASLFLDIGNSKRFPFDKVVGITILNLIYRVTRDFYNILLVIIKFQCRILPSSKS